MSGVDEPRSKEGRPVRNVQRIDYKTMNEGKCVEIASQSPSDTQSDGTNHWTDGAADDVLPGGDPDAEMARMKEEMAELDREEDLLKKSQDAHKMREELAEKRKTVQKLRGRVIMEQVKSTKSKTKPKSKSKKAEVKFENVENESSDINIGSLRKDENLRRLVKKELASLGLGSNKGSTDSSDTSTSSSSSSSDESSDQNIGNSTESRDKKKKKKKSHKKKSGISAKASDRVKLPQKWPHAHLHYEHVSKHVKFEELDFKLFIAGELEIISEEGLPKTERVGRLNLLKKIVYYSSTYDFKGLREFYAAWLREIEMGKKTWHDNSNEIESAILNKHIRPQKSTTSKFGYKKDSYTHTGSSKATTSEEEKVWFCSLYQKNKCSNRANHMIVVKGKMRMAMHICATCWLKDKKKLEHPESSTACPHQIA